MSDFGRSSLPSAGLLGLPGMADALVEFLFRAHSTLVSMPWGPRGAAGTAVDRLAIVTPAVGCGRWRFADLSLLGTTPYGRSAKPKAGPVEQGAAREHAELSEA